MCMCMRVQVTVKSELGLNYTQLTPSNSFLDKKFKQKFEGYPRPFTAVVKFFMASEDGVAANDKFSIGYSDKTLVDMSKSELVSHMTDLTDPQADLRQALGAARQHP